MSTRLCCGLGMASKEVMVAAPIMVVLYDWAFRSEPPGDVLRRRWRVYLALASTWMILVPWVMAMGVVLGGSAILVFRRPREHLAIRGRGQARQRPGTREPRQRLAQ